MDVLTNSKWSEGAYSGRIDIKVEYDALNGLDRILIVDNGDGIDAKDTANNFEKFNESSKKLDDDKHGSHGKGRLAFHKLCDSATWFTKRDGYHAKISIKSGGIKNFTAAYLTENDQHTELQSLNTGTCVELHSFTTNKLPDQDGLLQLFNKEFGWYLALNKST